MLRPGTPSPVFPADLIVPPHRGAVITATAWPLPVPPRARPASVQPQAVKPALAPALSADIASLPIATEPDRPDPVAPLPASRALVPRRQGFIDVLAFALRDSGRRLARWSSTRRRADDLKDKLAKAEARMRAMEAQLAALRAIQERVRP
jgi:hypothetical protein